MAVFVNRGIFGGGIYSTRAARFLKELGRSSRTMVEFGIAPRHGGDSVLVGGRLEFRPSTPDPFLPTSFAEAFHPTGNSLGYMVQVAHLLGADPIYVLGFTLQPRGAYFFGREHPFGDRPPNYVEPTLAFLRWYDSQHPGRVRLLPGFAGPVYDVLRTEDHDAYRERLACSRPQPEGAGSAS